jgi:hypothetical protein
MESIMANNPEFVFKPLPPIEIPIHFPFPIFLNPLGPLANLPGTWGGSGFNTIWRPNSTPGQDHFLELNVTSDSIQFDAINGPIPNRGLLQQDINMFGLTYVQQISDSNLDAGLHIEPGIWAVAPTTSNPAEGPTVVRMASIPHGTTMLAQGTSSTAAGAPTIPNINILPFSIGSPGATFNFQEQDLSVASNFRSPAAQLVGVTQAMVNNPNSLLQAAIAGQTILSTTTLQVTTATVSPLTGGGTANTSFLDGSAGRPNAMSATVTATFWIETVQGSPNFFQLQYSQLVLLNFNTLSWPHVTVGTLKLNVPIKVPIWKVDPRLPVGFIPKPGVPIPVLPIDPVLPIKPVVPIAPIKPAGNK